MDFSAFFHDHQRDVNERGILRRNPLDISVIKLVKASRVTTQDVKYLIILKDIL